MAPAAAAVLACALDLLGASGRNLPPITILARPPAGVSSNANGYVRVGEPVIYLVKSSEAFRDADCDRPRSLIHLASVIVHEAWHVRHGGDERGAYEAQLGAVLRLGLTPTSPVYIGVYRSMRAILKEEQERARAADAARARAAQATVARRDP
jgi:hypothetical protein